MTVKIEKIKCPECNNEDIWDVDCETCEGDTEIIVKGNYETCPDCYGEGVKQDWLECSKCHHTWEDI